MSTRVLWEVEFMEEGAVFYTPLTTPMLWTFSAIRLASYFPTADLRRYLGASIYGKKYPGIVIRVVRNVISDSSSKIQGTQHPSSVA